MIDDNQDGNRAIYGFVYLYYPASLYARVDLFVSSCIVLQARIRPSSPACYTATSQIDNNLKRLNAVAMKLSVLSAALATGFLATAGAVGHSEKVCCRASQHPVYPLAVVLSLLPPHHQLFHLIFTRCAVSLPIHHCIIYPQHAT